MNSAKIQPVPLPKGTRDFYPDSMNIQNFIFDTWRRAARRFGYEEYEGPMFEHLELYTGKSGEEIVGQLYDFTDKGERRMALRPEMTPTLARLVIQKGNSLKKPFKWFSIPRLFRYERTQKGRLREFFQLNLDIIGTESIYAEADLLSAISSMLFDFGLNANDFTIGVSSRKLLNAFLEAIGISDKEFIYPLLDRRLKMGEIAFNESLQKTGISENQTEQLNRFMNCKTLDALEKSISTETAQKALNELKQLFEALTAAGFADCVQLDLSVVRGLAYYTGIVFEVFDKNKSMRAIAGGGRYDNLCEKLGGVPVTGVGFGMGDVVLSDLLSERRLIPQTLSGPDLFIASFAGDMNLMFQTAALFRKKGFSVTHALSPLKLGKQMEQANSLQAKIVVYADGEKAPAGEFEYKILSSGEQSFGTPEIIQNQIKALIKKQERIKRIMNGEEILYVDL